MTGELKNILCPILAVLLALPPAVLAQTVAPPAGAPQVATNIRSLKVVRLAGNLELNDLENKVMAPLVVQVLDQSDLPVEGAEVVFRFPLEGPGATFGGKYPSATVRTNADGQAAATGWVANGKVGTFQVQVTASRGSDMGTTSVTMTNVTRIVGEGGRPRQKKWWTTKWGKLAIAAGAAGVAVGIVLATRKGSSTPPVITGTPGGPTIGGPQ